jgi:hypothetical protein
MNKRILAFGVGSGVLAFLLCLGGGLWILAKVGFNTSDDAISTGIGLYFIGKAVFVGAMLVLAALRFSKV